MDSSKVSSLPESNEARVSLVKTFFDSPAFQIAEEKFRERLFNAWNASTPTAYEDRENLYNMAKAFDGLKLELRAILENAETELARNENIRRQRDLDSRGREY